MLRGSLRFGAGLRGAVSVPAVKSVAGNVETVEGTGVTRISLSGLEEVVGSLAISGNALTALSIPLEHTIGGDLVLRSSPVLSDVELATTSIAGETLLFQLPALTALPMPNLVVARGADHGFLTAIQMDGVGLVTLEFPALRDSKGVWVTRSDALTAVRLPLLQNATILQFDDDAALETVSAPAVTTLKDLTVGDSQAPIGAGTLRELDFANLTTVSFRVLIEGAKLPDLSGLRSLQDASLSLRNIDPLPDLRSLVSLRTLRGLNLTSMPAMTSLAGLEGVTGVVELGLVDDAVLTDISQVRHVTTLTSLSLESNHALGDWSFPELTTISGILQITDMPLLQDLSGLSAVRSVGGEVLLVGNPGLSDQEIATFEVQIGR